MMTLTESFPLVHTVRTNIVALTMTEKTELGGKPSSLHLASRKMAVPRGGKSLLFRSINLLGNVSCSLQALPE